MIKGELQALVGELTPSRRWPKSTKLKDLCEFTVATFTSDSDDPRQRRAVELAQVIRDNERR